jgi:hypothetical protein
MVAVVFMSVIVRMGVIGQRLVVFMTVMPQLRFVEQKEKHQAHQKHREQIVGTGLTLKRLGHEVHKSRGQERARGQAQHVLGVTREQRKAQKRRHPHTAHARDHGAQQNRQ